MERNLQNIAHSKKKLSDFCNEKHLFTVTPQINYSEKIHKISESTNGKQSEAVKNLIA